MYTAISQHYGPLFQTHSMGHAPEQSQEWVQQMYNLQVHVSHISERTEKLQ